MVKRIEYIDQLKGLAILLVVMGHVCSKSFMIDGTSFNYFYSSFHMPLFMFLSGVFAYKGIINWNFKDAMMFLKKKTLRIIFPFVVFGSILSFFANGSFIDVYTGRNPSLWFLPALFYCMITGFIGYKILSYFKNPILFYNISVNLSIYGFLLFGYKYLYFNNIPFFLSFIKLYPFFIIGSWMTKYDVVMKIFSNSQLAYFISLIAYAICWAYNEYIPLQLRFTGLFATIVLVHYFKANESKIPNTLTFIGRYSLEIYLFHWFFLPSLDFMSDWYENTTMNFTNNFTILLVASFIVTVPIVALCIIFSKIIQENKYIRIVGFGNLK